MFGVLVTNTECDSGGLFIAQGVSLFRASKTFCRSLFLGIQSNVERFPWKNKKSGVLLIVLNTFIAERTSKHQMQFYKCNPIYTRLSLEKSWLWSNFSWGRFCPIFEAKVHMCSTADELLIWGEGLRSAATSGKDKTSSDKEDDRMIQRCNKFCVRHTKDKSVEF